jgi:hypothetical protein
MAVMIIKQVSPLKELLEDIKSTFNVISFALGNNLIFIYILKINLL